MASFFLTSNQPYFIKSLKGSLYFTNTKVIYLLLTLKKDLKNKNLLMMSSGNFDGMDINQLGKQILKDQDNYFY